MMKLTKDHQKLFVYGGLYILFLTLALLGIEQTLSYCVKQSGNAQTGKINLVMQHKIDPEILIIGSSVAEVGFHTQIIEERLKQSSYNMAIDGTVILGSEYLIDEFLSYSTNCKTIIIGMSFFSFSQIQNFHAPERFLAYKNNKFVQNNIKSVDRKLYNKLSYVPFYSFIIANHTYYKNAFIGSKNTVKKNKFTEDPFKGFVPHDSEYLDTRETLNSNLIKIDSLSINGYNRILNKIKTQNITPILILTPMHVNGQNSFSNYEAYRKQIKAMATDTETIMFDFSEHQIVEEEKYFYNNGHLNKTGARIFSHAVSDSLNLIIQPK